MDKEFKKTEARQGSHSSDQAVTLKSNTTYLNRDEGRIGYDIGGEGPLMVLVPGMGDLRATYRFLAPSLREAGFRVACTDLRGHGDSDATFATYGDAETASDLVALIDELGGPAVVIGNSMGAGSAALAAALRPDLVLGLVLVGPFVRNPRVSAVMRLILRVAMAPLWAPMTWKSYLPTLYAGRRPADFDEYVRAVVDALRRPGYAKAFSLTTRTNHAPVAARLADVTAAALVVMGEMDPDFPDPQAEASWIAQALHGEVVMVPEAGHYPQSQRPDITTDAILGFSKRIADTALEIDLNWRTGRIVTAKSEGARSATLQEPDLETARQTDSARAAGDGIVTGGPRRWLRVEGATLLVVALIAYSATRQPWWLVPLTLLVPDLSMVGYLGGTRLGGRLYNVAHCTPLPAIMVGLGWWQAMPLVLALGLVWFAHIGMDSLLGYGLKYDDHFQHTHLGWIGRSQRPTSKP